MQHGYAVSLVMKVWNAGICSAKQSSIQIALPPYMLYNNHIVVFDVIGSSGMDILRSCSEHFMAVAIWLWNQGRLEGQQSHKKPLTAAMKWKDLHCLAPSFVSNHHALVESSQLYTLKD